MGSNPGGGAWGPLSAPALYAYLFYVKNVACMK